ncbi:hypothetical protein [Saccharopolyspora phatthalungensis]|uniref:Uncharacterized protein n=1 Tax=Saccharopolyspora phatthalungensis TaxID=664693 RepID=A0A840QID6_9PSEU|nr:hypothetical protein [Saccharopolyspora phatthalungensis]MBB5157143.1 hypothetical protein [Saccharopolyspora phatthalungensis]
MPDTVFPVRQQCGAVPGHDLVAVVVEPRVRIETMPNPGREALGRSPVQMLSA